jgi:hypothetical protein
MKNSLKPDATKQAVDDLPGRYMQQPLFYPKIFIIPYSTIQSN